MNSKNIFLSPIDSFLVDLLNGTHVFFLIDSHYKFSFHCQRLTYVSVEKKEISKVFVIYPFFRAVHLLYARFVRMGWSSWYPFDCYVGLPLTSLSLPQKPLTSPVVSVLYLVLPFIQCGWILRGEIFPIEYFNYTVLLSDQTPLLPECCSIRMFNKANVMGYERNGLILLTHH